ncbi:MAG: MFS transporter [Chloroflexi bacterium]|nr:MAG: MFS transporter [Chloroflexota bacterium]
MDRPMPRALGARVLFGRRASFWIIATTFGLFLFAAAAPSPLYAVYAGLWQFSAGALTEVFAVYAIALLVALLFTGSSSDFVGRRPIILVALMIQLASIVLFLVASGIEWLFAARIAQGIATGIATGALGAALVDLQPPDNPALASLVNSAGPILSLGIGALASAVLVQYAPDPLHLVYWVTLLGFIAALAAVAVMPEPGARRSGVRWAPRISVERAVRREFVATLPILVAGWAVAGFYLSLGPSLASQLAASSNRVLGGLAIFLLADIGAVAIVITRAWATTRAMIVGGIILGAGLVVAVAAIALTSPLLFFAATALTGVGFGPAWLGVLRTLVALAAPTARAALLAAVFVVAYLALALPAVIAGFLATRIGLHDAALWYGAGLVVLTFAGVLSTWVVIRRR